MYLLIFVFLQYFYKGTICICTKKFKMFFFKAKRRLRVRVPFLKEKRNNVKKVVGNKF